MSDYLGFRGNVVDDFLDVPDETAKFIPRPSTSRLKIDKSSGRSVALITAACQSPSNFASDCGGHQSQFRMPDSLNTEFMPPSEISNHAARIRFHRFRLYFNGTGSGAQSKWNTEGLNEIFVERAILKAKDERDFPVLCEHGFEIR
jgi:hypothetical protein